LSNLQTLLKNLSRALIVSCQPVPDGPFDDPKLVVRFVKAAEIGGAKAVRVEGIENVKAVCCSTTLPVIGLVKRTTPGSDIYITPTLTDIEQLAEHGASIIAFDGTDRERPFSVEAMIARVHAQGCFAMADIATAQEGSAAYASGAEFVGTTLSGYTAASPQQIEPDLGLVTQLAQKGVRVIAEGRIAQPAQAAQALQNGAFAVTVGTAITRPEWITRDFTRALSESKSLASQGEETR
jgi:putative N-acetylmannosamine-6-phosphate epimerase